jgi:hypothetical protein
VSEERNQRRLVLYWVLSADGVEDNGAPLDQLLDSLNETSPAHFDIAMECAVASTPVLSSTATASVLQQLLNEGSVIGWRLNESGHEMPLANIEESLTVGQGQSTFLALTATGRQEAEAFGRLFESEYGRKIREQAWKQYVSQRSKELTFSPIVPPIVPKDTDPIPDVSIRPGEDLLELAYRPLTDEFSMPRLILTESSRAQPVAVSDPNRQYTQKVASFTASIWEFQISHNWSAVVLQWMIGGVHCSLLSQWRLVVDSTLSIDSKRREETLRVVESMLTASNSE